jgi:hypothetical protein
MFSSLYRLGDSLESQEVYQEFGRLTSFLQSIEQETYRANKSHIDASLESDQSLLSGTPTPITGS